MKQEFEVDEAFDGERLDKFLAQIYEGQSRSFFQKLIRAGGAEINHKTAVKNSTVLENGDLVTIDIPEARSVEICPEAIPLDILY